MVIGNLKKTRMICLSIWVIILYPSKKHVRMTSQPSDISSHISQIAAKAHARADVIHTCFLPKDRNIRVKPYETSIWPLLEYAVCVWSLTSSRMLLKFNPYNDALQSDFLVCLMLATTLGLRSLQVRTPAGSYLHI